MPLTKVYNPKAYEAEIYKLWEESGAFQPRAGKGEPFSTIMPPPNANGDLHAGHAMYVIPDILTRYARMQGRSTLWLPGTDHAGIETQFVYEKELAKQGKDRFDLGPAKFYSEVMAFTKTNQTKMLDQMRSLGLSADWSRLKFTLDEDIIAIVYNTFKRLHDDGHIYRGNRIVNWCPRCGASFADIEVAHSEKEGRIYTLDYGTIKIATTRPETIFADVAIAVNPDDKRYQKLIGSTATIPLVERPIPIIADSYVDPKFGTGALKITPAHDPNDYEIGKRHQLPEISVVDTDGKLVNVPDEFAGLTTQKGREKVIKALAKAKKLISDESHLHAVSIHDRCKSEIEPLISEQWFLRVGELNQKVITAIENDEVVFTPKRFKKVALNWLRSEHDWNISRQIWWGIRIPVFYKTSNDADKTPYIISADEDEAKAYYGEGNYRAETDTFDTWFSSGQWPYATLLTTGDFDSFYPTTFMGTAREILHKWITRMIMFGLYHNGKVPFRRVYLWGQVTDEHGAKMSKSKGNGVNPLDISAKFGTDALRMALSIGITPGNDGPLDPTRVEGYRNFANKLWNVARFVLDKLPEDYTPSDPEPKTIADEWMMSRLNATVKSVSNHLNNHRFSSAGNEVYALAWNDFADWYIEASKQEPNQGVLVYGLETILKLAHPFAPYVTEVIWNHLPSRSKMLIVSRWPKARKYNAAMAGEFAKIQAIVTEIRTIKTELQLTTADLYYQANEQAEQLCPLLKQLAGLKTCEAVTSGRGLPLTSTDLPMWLGVDLKRLSSYRKKLNGEIDEVKGLVKNLSSRLADRAYTTRAPKNIVNDTRQQLEAAKTRQKTLQARLKQLG